MVAQYHELTDSQWEVIKEFLPIQRKRKYDLRDILNAIFWILRTGSQWRNLDSRFPKWPIVYYYFRSWTKTGLIEKVNNYLSEIERQVWKKQAEPSLVVVDSQSVKVAPFIHQHKGFDGNKKVNGRKRHLLVDTLGLIMGARVGAANHHDNPQGRRLLGRFSYRLNRVQRVIVDSAYKGTFEFFASKLLGAEVEVHQRKTGQSKFEVTKKRWIVERTLACINFFRRLAQDYEKSAESFESRFYLMNCWIIFSKFEYGNG